MYFGTGFPGGAFVAFGFFALIYSYQLLIAFLFPNVVLEYPRSSSGDMRNELLDIILLDDDSSIYSLGISWPSGRSLRIIQYAGR